MEKDNKYLALLHYSQLAFFVFIYFGAMLLPLIFWNLKKDSIADIDKHGRAVLNWQISMMFYTLFSAVMTVFLYGFALLIAIAVLYLIVPLINGTRVSKGKSYFYPLSFKFL